MTPVSNRNSSSSPRASGDSIFETDFLAGKRLPEWENQQLRQELIRLKQVSELQNPPHWMNWNQILQRLLWKRWKFLFHQCPLSQLVCLQKLFQKEFTSIPVLLLWVGIISGVSGTNVSSGNRLPVEILDSKGVRILLYYCQSDMTVSNIHSYVIVIQNHNNFIMRDVILNMATNDKVCTCIT